MLWWWVELSMALGMTKRLSRLREEVENGGVSLNPIPRLSHFPSLHMKKKVRGRKGGSRLRSIQRFLLVAGFPF